MSRVLPVKKDVEKIQKKIFCSNFNALFPMKKKATLLLLAFCYLIFKKTEFSKTPDLTIYGFVKMADGLGRQTVEIIDALKEDLAINYKTLTTKDDFTDVPVDVLKIISNPVKKLGKVILYEGPLNKSSHLFLKKHFKNAHVNSIKIAYSMYESSLIPKECVHMLNIHFDAVAVPDRFLVEAYKNSGVSIPIFVLPLGLNLKSFLERPLKAEPNSPFVFANLSAAIGRKNLPLLIESFYEAFGDRDDVELRINARYDFDNHYNDLQSLIKTLGAKNVILSKKSLSNQEYLNLFSKVDCYVSLSQGEGFSIQPREAMALGIPVIVSAATAQETICDSLLAYSIPTIEKIPAFYEHLNEVYGYRFQVDKKVVVEALKEMKEHYSIYLQKNKLMREYAKSYDYENLSSLYLNLVKPKKVILGNDNILTDSYLMTSSETLYKKYNQL